MFASTGEPSNPAEVLHDHNWKKAMDIAFDALKKNKTLTPCSSSKG
jgi:hypothetical protein